MSIIPDKTIDILRTFSDLSVETYGISCNLYIPTNLTSLEGKDMYQTSEDISYIEYPNQKVWVEWSIKDFDRLRKLGVYSENDLPIAAYFKNSPEVIIHSYIKVDIRYIPDCYDRTDFEVVNTIMVGTYNSEVFRRYKLAPKREKNAY